MRLIDAELEITIEASSKEKFPVKIHPGRAKVRDVMEQIEEKLEVPVRDQKLYLGRIRLSDTPMEGLPQKLICSPQPTIVVIVPECIHVTIEDQSGKSIAVKINKEKGLTALMEEISRRINLPENEEAMLFFNGKQLCPIKDKGTLTSLGLFSGSKLELKVKVIFIEISVWVLDGSPTIRVRCNPKETFKDLMKKVGEKGKTRKLDSVTFAMEERVFDPDQDKSSLQGTACVKKQR